MHHAEVSLQIIHWSRNVHHGVECLFDFSVSLYSLYSIFTDYQKHESDVRANSCLSTRMYTCHVNTHKHWFPVLWRFLAVRDIMMAMWTKRECSESYCTVCQVIQINLSKSVGYSEMFTYIKKLRNVSFFYKGHWFHWIQ